MRTKSASLLAIKKKKGKKKGREECGTDRDHRVDQKYTVQLYVA